MDMYYKLKEKLYCQDCNFPLAYGGDTGFLSYTAICIACGQEYEVSLEVNLNKEKYNGTTTTTKK